MARKTKQGLSRNEIYYELVKEHLAEDKQEDKEVEKRKQQKQQQNQQQLQQQQNEPVLSSSFHQIRKQKQAQQQKSQSQHKTVSFSSDASSEESSYSNDSSNDDFDDADFEDVEIHQSKTAQLPSSVTVTIRPQRKQRKKSRMIDNQHRKLRKQIHFVHLCCMVSYGSMLSKRLNNMQLKLQYSSQITKQVYSELHPGLKNKSWGNSIKSRFFLDGLRHTMEFWSKRFYVSSSSGLYKHTWQEIEGQNQNMAKKKSNKDLSIHGLMYNLAHYRGTRDLGAQGFVALLRSVQVQARLVLSVQAPDFTIAAPVEQVSSDSDSESERPAKKKRPQRSNLQGIPKISPTKSKSKLQKIIASHNRIHHTKSDSNFRLQKHLKSNPCLSAYPVFWAEAWNPYIQKWITIDPVNFQIIEDIHRVSKLEPPMSDIRNNLVYAIAFDKRGNAKDVTRRYAEHYNSRTRRKRITRDKSGIDMFSKLMQLYKCNRTEMDILEDEYFTERNVKEGMPPSIGDFRNHPVYCLESQLRENEILYPRESCGFVTSKNSRNPISVPVFHRKNVQELRSAKGWFHKGRVIKVGERCLKTKRKSSRSRSKYKLASKAGAEEKGNENDEDSEDNTVRLYAEFQTEVYRPEPVENGIVPKNAYGNLDVYTESMIPEGGELVTSKFAIQAAKLVEVDYSPAVLGFEFGRKQSTKPKIEGVVVAKEFAEAVQLVSEFLKDEDVARQQRQMANRALKAWRLVFAKLTIAERLDREHGVIKSDEENEEEEEEEEEEEIEEEKRFDSEDEEIAYVGEGGFLPVDMNQEELKKSARVRGKQKMLENDVRLSDEEDVIMSEEEDGGGGFFFGNEQESEEEEEGGFFANNENEVEEEAEDEREQENEMEEIEKEEEYLEEGGGFFLPDGEESIIGREDVELEGVEGEVDQTGEEREEREKEGGRGKEGEEKRVEGENERNAEQKGDEGEVEVEGVQIREDEKEREKREEEEENKEEREEEERKKEERKKEERKKEERKKEEGEKKESSTKATKINSLGSQKSTNSGHSSSQQSPETDPEYQFEYSDSE